MRFTKQDLQHSAHGLTLINRHDQQGLGSELPANRCFNPWVGLGIFDTQNLTTHLGVVGRDTQCGRYMPPCIRSGTSDSGPVDQLVPLDHADRYSSGIGHVSRVVGNQVHRVIHVEIACRDQSLNFDDGGERLSIHPAFLHCKCGGQKLLERFAIEAGIRAHTGFLQV